ALFLFFFFSSRRRHTRFSRDWSSDVCSSDLEKWIRRHTLRHDVAHTLPALGHQHESGAVAGELTLQAVPIRNLRRKQRQLVLVRSEERRVGKEWRSRWSTNHEQEKATVSTVI